MWGYRISGTRQLMGGDFCQIRSREGTSPVLQPLASFTKPISNFFLHICSPKSVRDRGGWTGLYIDFHTKKEKTKPPAHSIDHLSPSDYLFGIGRKSYPSFSQKLIYPGVVPLLVQERGTGIYETRHSSPFYLSRASLANQKSTFDMGLLDKVM